MIRSVELIVQPGAKDAIGEMGVRGELPSGQGGKTHRRHRPRGARSDACGVKRTKVHVKALYFPGPVTWNPVTWQVPLRAVAHHPTGINLRMTEGLAIRERNGAGNGGADSVRSVYLDLAVGQPPGHIAQQLPIPPHITDASTHRAEPVDICRVVRKSSAYRRTDCRAVKWS